MLGLLFLSAFSFASTQTPIVLSAAAFCDDTLITPTDINNLYLFGKAINHILEGPYTIIDKVYTVSDLVKIEQDLLAGKKGVITQGMLRSLLQNIRITFLESSKKCMVAAHGNKNQFVLLIHEWCSKRSRLHSRLKTWSEIGDHEEKDHFEKNIITFKLFEEFCSDLLTFLSDIVTSCPKAHKKFKQRVQKVQDIHTLLPTVATVNDQKIKEFVAYLVKNHTLDKLEAITPQVLLPLWHEFRKTY